MRESAESEDGTCQSRRDEARQLYDRREGSQIRVEECEGVSCQGNAVRRKLGEGVTYSRHVSDDKGVREETESADSGSQLSS